MFGWVNWKKHIKRNKLLDKLAWQGKRIEKLEIEIEALEETNRIYTQAIINEREVSAKALARLEALSKEIDNNEEK